MNLRTITTRFAVAGVSTAVAASALVAGATGAANAADATGTYSCNLPLLGPTPLPVHVSVPLLPPVPTGMPVPAHLLAYTSDVTVPSTAAGLLQQLKVDGANISDFAIRLGSSTIGAPGTVGSPVANSDGSVLLSGGGDNDAFKVPAPGSYDLTLPSAFSFVPTVGGVPLDLGAGPVAVPCTTDAPASLGTVDVIKQTSTTTGTTTKTRKGYALTTKVVNQFSTATGQVVAKLGTKSWTKSLSKGKAVFSLPKSARGKKVSLTYKGDRFTAPSKGTVKVK
jgi:hypothetical protein